MPREETHDAGKAEYMVIRHVVSRQRARHFGNDRLQNETDTDRCKGELIGIFKELLECFESSRQSNLLKMYLIIE